MPGPCDQPSPSAQSHLLRGAEPDPRKWRRKERRMEEPQAGRRGCSVKTMNEQRPSAGLLPVAAPLWGGAHRGPALRSRTTRSPRRQLQPPTLRQMLTRICSSFNVKTQKYPVPSSLPRPPAACSRSFPWHRRKLLKGCDQLESLVGHRSTPLVAAPKRTPGWPWESFLLSRSSGLQRRHPCPLLHRVETRKQ